MNRPLDIRLLRSSGAISGTETERSIELAQMPAPTALHRATPVTISPWRRLLRALRSWRKQ